MMKLISLFSVTVCVLFCATAQDVHIHTPFAIPPKLPEAHAPTPVNMQWEREKMRLEHEYKMRELRANAPSIRAGSVPDEIFMPTSERPRPWYGANGKLFMAKLASYNRKTEAVMLDTGKGYVETTLARLRRDEQLYVLKTTLKSIP